MKEIREIAKLAKEASYGLIDLSSSVKTSALLKIADLIEKEEAKILAENSKDLEYGKKVGLSPTLLDRLALNPKRVKNMADGLRSVASLPDPVGEITGMKRRPNGLFVGKMRVAIGVIGIIYEARPNVTVDCASLCLKSGNSVVLRGGKEALNSNKILADIMQSVLSEMGIDKAAISFISRVEKEIVKELVQLSEYIDCIILRGGKGLIEMIGTGAKVPIIAHGEGICHTYIDEDADIDMAVRIAYNAKVQRPGVCNAMETLLVHQKIAKKVLPQLGKDLKDAGCRLLGCEKTRQILPDIGEATEEDWKTEYLDLILSIKMVSDINEAIAHITKYGSGHSDAIITSSHPNAMKFIKKVDSAAVYVNASTRFTDGGEFGLGAEMGISTQKLHARGPMGLQELTSEKFVILGDGQIRE
ncbi:MAG: glutamate-5-semialdehyde dehydrogenase [bacterium]|nr:glutamate-5-semialdehyde dehydrogenase [bacterium]